MIKLISEGVACAKKKEILGFVGLERWLNIIGNVFPTLTKKVFGSSQITCGSRLIPFTVSGSVGIVFFLLLKFVNSFIIFRKSDELFCFLQPLLCSGFPWLLWLFYWEYCNNFCNFWAYSHCNFYVVYWKKYFCVVLILKADMESRT